MATENQEAAYKKHRNDEKNYEAKPHLNSGLLSTTTLRAHAKEIADNLLATYPELGVQVEPKEVPEKPKESVPETKSKVRK